jgi:hypothetical protein
LRSLSSGFPNCPSLQLSASRFPQLYFSADSPK